MTIKAVIWDFAGVLLHTTDKDLNGLLAERLDAPVEKVAHAFDGEENKRWDLGDWDDQTFFSFLLKELNLPEEKRAIITNFFVKDFHVQPELLEYIRSLRAQYTTVLLTNFPSHLHKYLKTDWFIDGAFDHIIASCDVKLLKPDPRFYRYALDKIGCRANETLFIDDREVNIAGAESVGISSLLYQNTPQIISDIDKKLTSTL
jgi:putative hydrolase of the HAD superfamily